MKISKIFDNIGIKLICLLLALVIWLYANKGLQLPRRSEQGKITFRDVPVQLTGPSHEQWKPKPESISITVKCSAAEVKLDALQAIVSLTTEDGVKRRVVLTAGNVRLPEGIELVKTEPDEIELIH